MELDTKIAILALAIMLSVTFSGCAGKKDIVPASEPLQDGAVNSSSTGLARPSRVENNPEITIASFSSLYMRNNPDNREQYLFSWENVPGNESYRLLSFLYDELGIKWVEGAQIVKDNDRTIRVFTDENSTEILLENNKSALLNLSSYGIYYLEVKEENGKFNVYNLKYKNKYNVSERYYAVYDLTIKNNGPGTLEFKLNNMHLKAGDKTINPAPSPLEPYSYITLEVLSDLANENNIRDTILFPGESIKGSVTFRVDPLDNKSFLLLYNTTPINSASFEKGLLALEVAERFNYSVALGIPPYSNCTERDGMTGTYEPGFDDMCETWANWVNRSVFETYKKTDLERMLKSPPDYIPTAEMVYALKVVPDKNIRMFPVKTRYLYYSDFLVVDDVGEELINKSSNRGIAFLSNQTYKFQPWWKLNIPGMNLSNATVVQISFEGTYGWPLATRFSFNNQDVILDDKLNIIVVRYEPLQIVS